MTQHDHTDKDVGHEPELPEQLVLEAKEALAHDKPGLAGDGTEERSGTSALTPEASEEHWFAQHLHSYMTDYIKFADQKAAFVFTVSSALLCYLFRLGVHKMWLAAPTSWAVLDAAALLGMACLTAGVVLAGCTVLPRLARSHCGLVFFGSVCRFESAGAYSSEVLVKKRIQLTRSLLQHVYDLSRVCQRKYRVLGAGLWATWAGVILSVVVLLLRQ